MDRVGDDIDWQTNEQSRQNSLILRMGHHGVMEMIFSLISHIQGVSQ